MKDLTAFAPTSLSSGSANMAAVEATQSRRAFVPATTQLQASAVPGWFANFDSHAAGCKCAGCAHAAGCACSACANSHSVGCTCASCSVHSFGCQCSSCMTSGPLSNAGNVSESASAVCPQHNFSNENLFSQ